MATRAVSTVVNYAVMLAIVGLLVAGLLVGMNGHVDRTHERTARAGLSVVGNQLASDLHTADRLAAGVGTDGTVRVRSDLVEHVAGESYLIDIESADGSNRYVLTLSTDGPRVSASVSLRTDHPLETGRYHGGTLFVSYDGTSLEVAHD